MKGMEESNTEGKQKNKQEQKSLMKAGMLEKSENHVVKLKTNTQDKI